GGVARALEHPQVGDLPVAADAKSDADRQIGIRSDPGPVLLDERLDLILINDEVEAHQLAAAAPISSGAERRALALLPTAEPRRLLGGAFLAEVLDGVLNRAIALELGELLLGGFGLGLDRLRRRGLLHLR